MKYLKILIPLVVIIAFGCKKNGGPTNVASLSDFPLANGDTWTYQVDDSVNHSTQSATFTITGKYNLSGAAYYNTQTIINGTIVDSGQIITWNDSVIYQPNGTGLFSNLILLFPIVPNHWWHTQYWGDSVFVIGYNNSVTVLGNTYDSVYNVGRIQSVPDLYIHQNLYIAPHVGIVQGTLDVAPWIPVHKTVKLVSYSLH
jgi:hypothetical protein